MSRCLYCGNELFTWDFHWQQNICNTCYNKINNNHRGCEMVESFNKEIAHLKEDYEHFEATERMRQEVIDEGLKCERQPINNQNIIAIEELNKVLKQLTATTNPNILKYLIQRIKELEVKDDSN